jgi:hypothetical protein
MVTHSPPSFPLGVSTSRGYLPGYEKAQSFRQSTPTALAKLPAQGMQVQVQATVPDPALLPGARVPTAGSPQAGGIRPNVARMPIQSPAR